MRSVSSVRKPKADALIALAREGPVRARDLDAAGIPRTYLRRLQDRGLLEQVDRGIYHLVGREVTELHTLAQVAKRIPHATMCLLSALQFHHLTTELPHAVWIMIDVTARFPKVTTPKLEVVRASGAARSHGIEHHRVEGVDVAITSRAKTVADCFRFRRHVGLGLAVEALRQYVTESRRSNRVRPPEGSTIDELMAAATADRVLTLMRPYIEALV